MLRFLLFWFFFLPAFCLASSPSITRIVYVTLDGVRWQDVFNNHAHLQTFWNNYAKQGVLYGEPNTNKTMEVASIPISLPSYQSQMAGSVQPCASNVCGRINVETVAENIVHQLGLNKKDAAIFASWPEVMLAVEHIPGITFTNVGNTPMADPETAKPDDIMRQINEEQNAHRPSGFDRFDKYTFAQALHYLEKYQPRFLWISLQDADEAAHDNNLIAYQQALTAYDAMLDTLFTTLKNLNLLDHTLVILTTDHGRGNDDQWTDHGPWLPESKQTWAFVMNGELIPTSVENGLFHYSTLSIRPTIEKALGL